MQWQNLIRSTLLQEQTENSKSLDESPLEKLEVVANLTGDKLNIVFRKDISGIHQKLGELTLLKDESQEIDVSEWASIAVSRGDNLEHELQTLQQKLNDQTATVQKLHNQLEDLIQSKKDHEDLLFSKFAALLNEKKLKIRQQSQLLYTAKLDPHKAAELQKHSRSKPVSRKPDASRTSKRRASATASGEEEEKEEDSSFENSTKPQKEHEHTDSEDQATTPPHSDLDATEDEMGSDDLNSMPAPSTTKGKLTQDGSNERMKAAERTMEDLPPRRELPFNRDGGGDGKAGGKDQDGMEEKEDVEMENANGEETDDDDDDDDEL